MEGLIDSFRITAALGALDSLIPLAAQQMGMEFGWVFEGDLTKLHENLTKIQALLLEAENQPEIRKVRIKNLTSVISGAQEVLDEVRYETLRMSNEVHDQMGKKVHHFFSLFNPSQLFRRKVVHKVKHINALIEKICESPIDSSRRPADNRVNDAVQPSTVEPTNASIDDSKIVGRDRDVSIVKDMLIGCDRQDGSRVRVIAIVGMAGLGKTTLAQLVYNDNKVVENFGDKRRWIDVSADSKFETILNEVQSLTRVTSERPNTEGIVGKHLDNINGDKHLLVLDGVFTVLEKNSVQWEDLRNALLGIDGSKGSSIILTTRSMDVVSNLKISPSLTHHLNELSGGDSWTMFRKLAFADGGPRETQILVEIGIRIVEKCKGVPFAIKSVASLLCSRHDRSEWMSTWSSVENEARILQLLRLSFEQLPSPSLKRCFAYCAVFPKGSDIGKDQLIQLWMSLGYLHPPLERNLEMVVERNLEMEDVGSDYCKVLSDNSLLKQVEMDEYKNITSFKMHDHVHDLAMHLSKGVRLTLEPSEKKYSVVEHLSLDFAEEKSIPIAQGNVDMLTTLFPKIIVDANCALAFGLFGDDVEKLPNSICKFIRLRYLDVSETSIRKLPNFITKLYSLETLKLPRDLRELPKEFHKLVSLRHCCMPDSIQSRKLMPMNIGKLTALQTLPFFVVGKDSGHRIEELGSLSKLRGRLHVYDLQHIESKEAAEKAKMVEKSNIQELGFHWDRDRRIRMWDTEYNNVLEGLQPHENLKGLILENFGGGSFPFWLRSVDMPLLPNLVKIELRYCRICEQIPSFGHLKFLEIIEIVELNNLKRINPEFWGCNDKVELAEVVFPALRKLTLDGMPILKEWSLPPGSSHTAFFPCLEELNISGCPQLITIPSHLFSIHELTISSLSLSNVESGKKCHPSLTICSDDWDSLYMEPFMEDLLEKSSKSVRNLTIRGLKLRYLPNNLRNLVSLKKFEIIECSNLISDSSSTEGLYNLTSLQQLSIKGCPELKFLREGLVQQALVTLEIDSCRNLEVVELGSCTSLENFLIKGCPRLVSCWEKGLLFPTSLRRLEIGAFSEDIQSFPWPSTSACNANVDADIQPYASTSAVIAAANQPQQIFMSLTSLHLWGWEKLAHLPEELQHFTTLRELSINSFHLLQALPEWLANISSLQSLEVCGCKSLTSFPSARLASLLFLTVKDCTLLRKRCKRGVGPEWRKIAHIPCVSISFSAKCKPETVAARQLK